MGGAPAAGEDAPPLPVSRERSKTTDQHERRQTRAHTTKEGGDREPEGSRVWKAALGGGMMAGEGLGVGTPGADLVTERLELQTGLMDSVDGTACSGPSAVPGVSTCSGQAGGQARVAQERALPSGRGSLQEAVSCPRPWCGP